MKSFAGNTPTYAAVIVAGAVVFLVAVGLLFRGSVHF